MTTNLLSYQTKTKFSHWEEKSEIAFPFLYNFAFFSKDGKVDKYFEHFIFNIAEEVLSFWRKKALDCC